MTEQSNIRTVWSPDAGELVTGTVYHETATQICIQTDAGRIVGGPKSRLIVDFESSASRQHYIDTGEYLRPGEAIEA
jgi:hypothetical protein